jgi:hypothetical protein
LIDDGLLVINFHVMQGPAGRRFSHAAGELERSRPRLIGRSTISSYRSSHSSG